MSHSLQRYDEFKNILQDYHIGDEGREALAGMKYVITAGPTSAGRTSLIDKLVSTGKYARVVSNTTRPMRENDGVKEVDGDPYWFKTEEQMLDDLREGRMLEAEIIHGIQVSGVSIEALKQTRDQGKIAVTEMDFMGVTNIHKIKPDVDVLFVVPPSYEVWIERLEQRGNMSQEEITHRLSTAEAFFEVAINTPFYKFVINHDLDDTMTDARRIVETGEYSEEEHKAGIDLCWKLLNQVKQTLNS